MSKINQDPVLVFTMVASLEQADALGVALVKARLAACVNIIPGARSIYMWQGKLEHEAETMMFIKTTSDKTEALLSQARTLHPYDLPALLVLPVSGGDKDYLAWAASMVADSAAISPQAE